ncbi:response regulator [Paraburkholderia sp. MMS20-SJTN17]|uniref:Response regulator n=1 Tax=Paraburkholderia translucens TaxID=2886945 RepID=A0ABS8KLE4_9BURK|nr:response regulator [Paraburkholderia sp. MMS20-SJTN17]MCC8405603.1 response regulator [Paraburkholderia sp. MMS20-SJTN17]
MSPSANELVSIVDDDPLVRTATSSLVRSLGWDAREFSCAEDFLASNERMQTHCLLCDVRMPGMNGMELLERLEAEGLRIPTLLITAFATARILERARASTALRLLEKPIDAVELETWIVRALNQR